MMVNLLFGVHVMFEVLTGHFLSPSSSCLFAEQVGEPTSSSFAELFRKDCSKNIPNRHNSSRFCYGNDSPCPILSFFLDESCFPPRLIHYMTTARKILSCQLPPFTIILPLEFAQQENPFIDGTTHTVNVSLADKPYYTPLIGIWYSKMYLSLI